jgi:hypothetical protein
MFKTGTCSLSVILKNRNVRDAPVETQRVITCFIGSQHICDVRLRHEARDVRVIWTLYDYVVNPEASHTPPRAVNDSGRLDVGRERGKFIGDHTHLPCLVCRGWDTHQLWRSLVLIARAERAGINLVRRSFRCAARRQFFGARGALGGNDDPLFGEVVLPKFRHVQALDSPIGKIEKYNSLRFPPVPFSIRRPRLGARHNFQSASLM